jgi:hypothetical protein
VTEQAKAGEHLNMGYIRLSPFSPEARQTIREIYQDLAKSASLMEFYSMMMSHYLIMKMQAQMH